MRSSLFPRGAACVLSTLLLLTGCGGGGGDTPAPSPTKPAAPAAPIASTASAGVTVYPTKLDMPGLDRQRGILIYLPPGYATSTKRYPVIYMHDAQNLFDEATAQAGEWQVDESMDALAKEGVLEAIVVGIDRGGEIGNLAKDELRGRELMPFAMPPAFTPSNSQQYMNFVVNVVKPRIDKEYRTLPDRENTAIAGASLGGMISYYAINEYPKVFGRAIMFSSSFIGAGPQQFIYEFENKVPPKDSRLYFQVGGAEDPPQIKATQDVYARQLAKGHQAEDITLSIPAGATHGEPAFRAEFKKAAQWAFAKPLAVLPPPPPPPSTAGPGVTVYPTQLDMPVVQRTRGLRIYLPPGYATSGKRYPVIYMHDAQNLFDDATAENGKGSEWQVDESMDELAKSGQLEAIVVGIDRAGEPGRLKEDTIRERELTIFDLSNPTASLPSAARSYMDFVVKVVKPRIDQEYRTLPDRANTAIMGAELGGMISYYAGIEYPTVFSKVGLFSPQLNVGYEKQGDYYLNKVPPKDTRIYFLVSDKESPEAVDYDNQFVSLLPTVGAHNPGDVTMLLDTSGAQNEALWRAGFKKVVLWLFNKGTPATP